MSGAYLTKNVAGTEKNIWYKDHELGEGKEIELKTKVKLRYLDNDWDYPWRPAGPRPEYTLELIVGEEKYGKGLDAALLGMKQGGVREAYFRLDLALGITTQQKLGANLIIEVLEVE